MLDGLFTARLLRGAVETRRAYALVALAHPEVTARQWNAFVRRYTRTASGRGGLVAVQDRRGYVHAVFRYAVDAMLLTGGQRALRLRDLVVAQLSGNALALALVTCAEHLAVGLGCASVTLDVPAVTAAGATPAATIFGHAGTVAALQAGGFWMAAVTMARTLALT